MASLFFFELYAMKSSFFFLSFLICPSVYDMYAHTHTRTCTENHIPLIPLFDFHSFSKPVFVSKPINIYDWLNVVQQINKALVKS